MTKMIVTKPLKNMLPCSTSSLVAARSAEPINQVCHRCFVRISNIFGHQQNRNSATLPRSILLGRSYTSKAIKLVHPFQVHSRLRSITLPSFRNGSSTSKASFSSSSTTTTKRKLRNRKLGEKRNNPEQQTPTSNQKFLGVADPIAGSHSTSTNSSDSVLSRFGLSINNKKYGVLTSRDRIIAMIYRVPLWIVICILMVSDETSPISILQGSGPSMLPTMATSDEIWLIHNLSIYRNFGLTPPTLSVNDIVLWKQPEDDDESGGQSSAGGDDVQPQRQQDQVGGRRRRPLACKRIVGVEGDVVKRYGKYCHIYANHRDDGGIRWPANTTDLRHFNEDQYVQSEQDASPQHHTEDNMWDRTVVVPKNHVWLEGDCPLLSIDSRHVGPVPIEWIRGKVVARLWPLGQTQKKLDRNQRPVPYPQIEDYLGEKCNLYRIRSCQKQQQREE